jgi:hypothetical protein
MTSTDQSMEPPPNSSGSEGKRPTISFVISASSAGLSLLALLVWCYRVYLAPFSPSTPHVAGRTALLILLSTPVSLVFGHIAKAKSSGEARWFRMWIKAVLIVGWLLVGGLIVLFCYLTGILLILGMALPNGDQ